MRRLIKSALSTALFVAGLVVIVLFIGDRMQPVWLAFAYKGFMWGAIVFIVLTGFDHFRSIHCLIYLNKSQEILGSDIKVDVMLRKLYDHDRDHMGSWNTHIRKIARRNVAKQLAANSSAPWLEAI